MSSTERHYSKAEFARRGDEVYEKLVRPRITDADEGKFVAVDIESGDTSWLVMSSKHATS